MPAASTKSENKASAEVIDPIKQAVNLLDKKVRNLEKRKSKLDAYKAKADNGATLEKDQEEAIAHYEEVIQNLEFAKDLQKQIISISMDADKVMKKQAKRDKMERQLVEIRRFRELLQLQSMLDNLGSDSVRNDFKTGKHGAVVLTEENLTQLDELYKLISPTRDGEQEFGEQLNQAAEHMVSLLDCKEKEVVGTTYKELKELMDLINGCGYFENMPSYEEEAEEEKNPEEAHVPPTEPEYEEPLVEHVEEDPQPVHVISAVSTNEPVSQQYSQPIEQEDLEVEDDQQNDVLEQESYYSASSAAYRQQRPFQEIVSSVQGSFNFLQESTIDIESPHMDPAVVAMAPAPIPHPVVSGQIDNSSGISQQSYAAQAMLGDHHHQNQQSSRGQQAPLDSQQSAGSVDYSSHGYNQNALSSQSLTGPTVAYQLNDTTSTHPTQSQNIHSQSTSAGLTDSSVTSMMPAHIPIPNQSNLSQDDDDDEDASNQSEKKPFTMNANAAVFQSMYSSGSGSGSGGQSDGEKSQQQNSTQSSSTDYQSNSQGGFQNNNNSYQRSGSGGNRGGFRGGRGSRGGMTNGYPPRGGSRGGSMNGRGGGGNDRDTSRGSSSYQGYPPRGDYRPDGYQGYNNNNTSYYNKRGGGGPPRGGSRGGPRGGSGGRGGPRTGGFGRPMNMNAQTTMSQ